MIKVSKVRCAHGELLLYPRNADVSEVGEHASRKRLCVFQCPLIDEFNARSMA
jgi:hypothetical protein